MAKRSRRTLPFPVQPGAVSHKPLEVRPLGDKAKLLYARANGAAEAAVIAANQALANTRNVIAEAMLDCDHLKESDGWKLNLDHMRWERHPMPA